MKQILENIINHYKIKFNLIKLIIALALIVILIFSFIFDSDFLIYLMTGLLLCLESLSFLPYFRRKKIDYSVFFNENSEENKSKMKKYLLDGERNMVPMFIVLLVFGIYFIVMSFGVV